LSALRKPKNRFIRKTGEKIWEARDFNSSFLEGIGSRTMLWLIFAMLSILGVVGILDSSTMIGGFIQITLISALVALGIHKMQRYRVD
jgi:hypothetical protein